MKLTADTTTIAVSQKDLDLAEKRFYGMSEDQMKLRIRKMNNPDKLEAFAEVLTDNNYHTIAKLARDKLQSLQSGTAPQTTTRRPSQKYQPPSVQTTSKREQKVLTIGTAGVWDAKTLDAEMRDESKGFTLVKTRKGSYVVLSGFGDPGFEPGDPILYGRNMNTPATVIETGMGIPTWEKFKTVSRGHHVLK